MPHAFFGLTMAGCIALCAFGVLPSGQFVDIAKWSTILYAASTTVVTVVRHVWPRSRAPQFENLAVTDAPPSTWAEANGVGLPWGFGSLRDDVFSGAMGEGVQPNYTSMVRDHNAPPVTTEGADGSPVLVPVAGHADCVESEDDRTVVPPLDFDGVFGPRPPIPHDYNRRDPLIPPANRGLPERLAARATVSNAPDPHVVILGDPPTKGQP